MSARAWRSTAVALLLALIGWQLVWHVWLAPPASLPLGFVLGLALPALLVPLLMMWRNLIRGLFWAGFMALGYFTHGVMEAWATPELRMLANVQWVLATLLILAVGAAGMAERRARRAKADAETKPESNATA